MRMSEKGGKGYNQFNNGRKSAIKTPLSAGLGQSNGSAKSRKGANVQFEFEGTPNTPLDLGGNVGNVDKAGKGSKSPVKKATLPLQLRVEEELPENVKCVMDCEVAQILEVIQDQMVVLSKDPTIKLPISFDKGLQYVKKGVDYTNPQSVKEVLQSLKKYGVADSEICMIANMHPDDTDEVFALVPSLEGKKKKLEEPLESALGELAKLNRSA